jgi:hypothetical protein
MVRPIASFVVAMGLDGRVSSQGSITDALLSDSLLEAKSIEEEHVLNKVDSEVDNPSPAKEQHNDGKLIVAEEVEQGHISWASCKFLQTWAKNRKLIDFSETLSPWPGWQSPFHIIFHLCTWTSPHRARKCHPDAVLGSLGIPVR